MSLRWSQYVAPKPPPPMGAQKRKTVIFRLKSHFAWRKSATKFLCVKNVSDSCKAFIGLTNRAKIIVGVTPSTWNFGSNWPRWNEIADFPSIFVRSASAVTPSEKSSINTNRKSTTRFPMSPRWTSYVASKPPKGGSITQNVKKLEQ